MNKQSLSKYYHNTLFAFLPNICNSSCDFCYVNPLKGKTAILNKNIVNHFEILVKQAKLNGIDTIRITGGEPLIFNNFNELVLILKQYNLDYTIITNGQELFNQLKYIKLFIPKKITVSLHSFINYEKIFKNDIDFSLLFKSLKTLYDKGTIISISIVYHDLNKSEIDKMITSFEQLRFINEVKIIYPNTTKINTDLMISFAKRNFNSSTIKVRYTDFNQKECLLKTRGFLSVIVENLKSYNCCTTIGEIENETDIDGDFNLSQIMQLQFENNKQINKFPCKSYINCCPISLKNSP